MGLILDNFSDGCRGILGMGLLLQPCGRLHVQKAYLFFPYVKFSYIFLEFNYYTASFLKLLLHLIYSSVMERQEYDNLSWKSAWVTSAHFPVSFIKCMSIINTVGIRKEKAHYMSILISSLKSLKKVVQTKIGCLWIWWRGRIRTFTFLQAS